MKLILVTVFLLTSSFALAQSKVAVVKMLRGEVDVLTLGKTTKLKIDDWVESGAVVKTAEKSFVKLVFVDKSQMNVGPNSEMKIEKFSGEDAGVIDLVKGKIRSQVTKDYLQIKDKDKSKLFIKTPTAVMGIRGTDFLISTNGSNTAAVLFEGEVVFNRIGSHDLSNTNSLEQLVDRGVRLYPGDFSVVVPEIQQPTVPSRLNIQQLNNLEKNESFDSDRTPSNTTGTEAKSIVPAGLNGHVVSNNTAILKNEITQVTSTEVAKPTEAASANPDGFIKGNEVKPANGSFLHVESGVIIPPGPGSVLDANTNTYIPVASDGKAGADGSYIPPKNVEITTDGKIFVASVDKNGQTLVQEAPKKLPVVESTIVTSHTLPGTGSAGTNIATTDALKFNAGGTSNFMNNQMQQGGGVNNVNESVATGGNSTLTQTRVIVKPD
mgnify:CR=1 FL=1